MSEQRKITFVIGAETKEFAAEMSKVSQRVQSIGKSMSGMGKTLSAAVTLPLVGLGTAAVTAAGKLELQRAAFTQLTGSAESAEKILNKLREFSTKTPFQFDGLARSTQLMTAMGIEAGKATEIVARLADGVAAGGGGQEELMGVARALGQIQAKGKLSTEEVLQMAERGIPAFRLLQEGLGLTSDQMGNLGAQGISASDAITALVDGLAAPEFAGAAEKLSQTTMGLFSTLKDVVQDAFRTVGEQLIVILNLKENLQALTGVIKSAAEGFASFAQAHPELTKLAVGFALVLAALGPALIALGSFVQVVGFGVAGLGQLIALFPGLSGGLLTVQASLAGITAASLATIATFAAVGVAVAAVAGMIWLAWDEVLIATDVLREMLVGTWDAIIDEIGMAWASLVEGAGEAWNNLKIAIIEKVGAIEEEVGVSFQSVLDAVGGVWDSIVERVTGAAGAVYDAVVEYFTKVAEDTRPLWGPVAEVVAEVMQAASDAVDQFITDITDWFNNVMAPGLDSVVEMWDKLSSGVSGKVGELVDWVLKDFRRLKREVDELWQGATDAIDNALAFWKSKITGDVDAFAQNYVESLDEMGEKSDMVADVATQAAGEMASAAQTGGAAASQAGAAAAASLEESAEKIKTAAETMAEVNKKYEEQSRKAAEASGEAAEAMEGAGEAGSEAKGGMEDAAEGMDNVSDAAKGAAGSVRDLNKEMMIRGDFKLITGEAIATGGAVGSLAKALKNWNDRLRESKQFANQMAQMMGAAAVDTRGFTAILQAVMGKNFALAESIAKGNGLWNMFGKMIRMAKEEAEKEKDATDRQEKSQRRSNRTRERGSREMREYRDATDDATGSMKRNRDATDDATGAADRFNEEAGKMFPPALHDGMASFNNGMGGATRGMQGAHEAAGNMGRSMGALIEPIAAIHRGMAGIGSSAPTAAEGFSSIGEHAGGAAGALSAFTGGEIDLDGVARAIGNFAGPAAEAGRGFLEWGSGIRNVANNLPTLVTVMGNMDLTGGTSQMSDAAVAAGALDTAVDNMVTTGNMATINGHMADMATSSGAVAKAFEDWNGTISDVSTDLGDFGTAVETIMGSSAGETSAFQDFANGVTDMAEAFIGDGTATNDGLVGGTGDWLDQEVDTTTALTNIEDYFTTTTTAVNNYADAMDRAYQSTKTFINEAARFGGDDSTTRTGMVLSAVGAAGVVVNVYPQGSVVTHMDLARDVRNALNQFGQDNGGLGL